MCELTRLEKQIREGASDDHCWVDDVTVSDSNNHVDGKQTTAVALDTQINNNNKTNTDSVQFLPRLLCPSSEEKSRQIQVKKWLDEFRPISEHNLVT